MMHGPINIRYITKVNRTTDWNYGSIPVRGRDVSLLQNKNESGGPSASYPLGIIDSSFPGTRLTIHLQSMSRLGMRGAIPLPHIHTQGVIFNVLCTGTISSFLPFVIA